MIEIPRVIFYRRGIGISSGEILRADFSVVDSMLVYGVTFNSYLSPSESARKIGKQLIV